MAGTLVNLRDSVPRRDLITADDDGLSLPVFVHLLDDNNRPVGAGIILLGVEQFAPMETGRHFLLQAVVHNPLTGGTASAIGRYQSCSGRFEFSVDDPIKQAFALPSVSLMTRG